MKLTFCGGAGIVTGANYLLETGTTKILVDCGMFQGGAENKGWNQKPFLYDPKTIDAVILTHAHLDHGGRLPLLYKQGYRGPIYATPPTAELAQLVVEDSEEIMTTRAQEGGSAALYSHADVAGVGRLWRLIEYKQRQSVGDVQFQLRNAGHILGSSMVEVWAEGKKLLFTGDLGNELSPLLPPADVIDRADYVIIESAYGDRVHEPVKDRKEQLERAIEHVVKHRGALIIPSLAVERTQEILYDLDTLVEDARVPRIAVYIDSPMAAAATEIYQRHHSYLSAEGQNQIRLGDNIFEFPGLKITRTREESKAINSAPAPKVIIAGNGMSTGGRIIYHEQLYLPDSQNILLLVSYQVNGTNGRQLQEGATHIRIGEKDVPVRATILQALAYSGHADHDQLMAFVQDIQRPIQHIFTVQGDDEAAHVLATNIQDEFGINASVPKIGEVVEL
ncbi:MBL fold metallo-hydrolase [Candidatus Uhrbacteria bacterium]|nr:MBL fold metallo-hydrolase [Candidatus Uhrbacteria bacterium]